MDLWTQFVSDPWSRSAVIAVVLPFIVNFIKPYLPTGSQEAHATGDVVAIENRYVPLATVILGGVLGLIGALYVNVGTDALDQDVFQSAVAGLSAGFAAAGGVRFFNLQAFGDRTAKANAKLATALVDRGVDPREVLE